MGHDPGRDQPVMACHGPLGEGSDIGPRLAGLTDDDIEAVAHYFESVQVN
jgi:cytochrome c553